MRTRLRSCRRHILLYVTFCILQRSLGGQSEYWHPIGAAAYYTVPSSNAGQFMMIVELPATSPESPGLHFQIEVVVSAFAL